MYLNKIPEDCFTDLDNIAWRLFISSKTNSLLRGSKTYFAYYKKDYPYCLFYKQAQVLLRSNKLNKIMNNVKDTRARS